MNRELQKVKVLLAKKSPCTSKLKSVTTTLLRKFALNKNGSNDEHMFPCLNDQSTLEDGYCTSDHLSTKALPPQTHKIDREKRATSQKFQDQEYRQELQLENNQ